MLSDRTRFSSGPAGDFFFLPAAEEAALYDFDHERRRLLLAHLRIESAPVESKSVRLAIDAWETFSPTVYQTPQAVGYGLTHSKHVPYIMKEMNE